MNDLMIFECGKHEQSNNNNNKFVRCVRVQSGHSNLGDGIKTLKRTCDKKCPY